MPEVERECRTCGGEGWMERQLDVDHFVRVPCRTCDGCKTVWVKADWECEGCGYSDEGEIPTTCPNCELPNLKGVE